MSMTTEPFVGSVYKLLNPLSKTCYIGSTTYKYPKRRYGCHCDKYSPSRQRYPELFEGGDPVWIVLHQITYTDIKELRQLENEYINIYKSHPSLKTLNIYSACATDESNRQSVAKAKAKYYKTDKGKVNAYWGGWRNRSRKKISLELHKKVALVN
jgi:hypothetical protein